MMIYGTSRGMPWNHSHQHHIYEFLMAAKILMHENGLHMPTRVDEALDFFITLKYLLHNEMITNAHTILAFV